MSDTPETDAAQHEGLLRTNPIPMQVVTANFARKLERERDEAREQYDNLATEHMLAVNKLAKERDEALMDRANGDMATMTVNHYERILRERDEAIKKIQRQAERICQLEGATNHAGGTPLSLALRERDEARAERDILRLDAQREAEQHDRMVGELEKVYAERDEARQRASDLALGVKVACEAKIRARHLQELTRAAYDEVEKLEDQEAPL